MAEHEPVLRFAEVTKVYGTTVAVDGLSLEVGRGEIVALVGPDGAGKTTVARLAAGVLAPTSGRVEPRQRGRAGYLSERLSLYYDLTAWENIVFFGRLYGMRGRLLTTRAGMLLQQMDLAPFANRLAGQLSGGMRQKLGLACALIHEPPVLILDEPTTGVDPLARHGFWALLRQVAAGGTAVFLTTPYMDEAEGCHRVGLLHRGHLLALESPSALKSRLPVRMTVLRPSSGERMARTELLRAAERLPGRRWVQQVGGGVRVALDAGAVTGGGLPHAPAGMSLAPAEPSLEDVYVWLAGDVPA